MARAMRSFSPRSRAYDKFDITFGFPGPFLRMRSCKPDGTEQKRHTCPKHHFPHLIEHY